MAIRMSAMSRTSGANYKVWVTWQKNGSHVEVLINDEGPGIANSGNLFVPFFTTKPSGSGIGLVLSRQIAEAHKGRLSVQNRRDGSGCVARLILPLGAGEQRRPGVS
jgi:two-component system, NtrC family, nitrogen regulation sensor histidine kinase NtrY